MLARRHFLSLASSGLLAACMPAAVRPKPALIAGADVHLFGTDAGDLRLITAPGLLSRENALLQVRAWTAALNRDGITLTGRSPMRLVLADEVEPYPDEVSA